MNRVAFHHYQTAHCIDVPEKDGHLASYGFRHFLQALLVRKLLWEQVPARQIVTMLNGRGTDELERMLLGGGFRMLPRGNVSAPDSTSRLRRR